MRIAYFVNSVMTEKPSYSTSRLALESINRGHEVWTIQADSFILDEKDKVRAVASRARCSRSSTRASDAAAAAAEAAAVVIGTDFM